MALTVADVQTSVDSGIGGQNIAENIEGRERIRSTFVTQRFPRQCRSDARRLLIATPSGAQIPIGQVAKFRFHTVQPMIRDEEGRSPDISISTLEPPITAVSSTKANKLLHEKLALPAGYTYKWSGEYEFELRAKRGCS